ncbi:MULTISPECIES: hypothetical protein [Mycolicibacterium]|nr:MULTISPECIES: hypothetical protein [Mycolicibacterium]WSE55890.1 hypothetical protein QGN32_21360 [Mycolicibacterium sp. ND9-15]
MTPHARADQRRPAPLIPHADDHASTPAAHHADAASAGGSLM